jgi:glycosyltransferase involved in cell wall biosynthesis
MRISIICLYHNPHINSVFYELSNNDNFDIKFLAYTQLPENRKKLGWQEIEDKSHILFRKHPIKWLKYFFCAECVFIAGLIAPFPWMIVNTILSIGMRKKIFLISEGFKNKRKRVFMNFIKILDVSYLNCLCIGYKSVDDFKSLGIKKWKFYKYGFFENYSFLVKKDVSNPQIVEILTAGSLIPRKNFSQIIDTLKRYTGNKNIVFRIAGDGPLLNKLRKQLKDLPSNVQVRFEGVCDKQKLFRLFAQADIFVLSSLYDGWGVVVNQAIACSVPPIVSINVRSGREHLIESGYNGFIYDGKNQLEKQLFTLIDDDELREYMSMNCKKVYTIWNIETVAKRLNKFLKDDQAHFQQGPLAQL